MTIPGNYKRPKREKDLYIYGIRPVIEAMNSGKSIEKIYMKSGLRNNISSDIYILAKEKSIPLQVVPPVKLQKLSGNKNHQGVIALVSLITYQNIELLLPGIYEKGQDPFFLFLDGITDVRNIGAIARTAECSGAHGIIIPGKGSAQINADAVKTSAGALQHIPVCRSFNIKKTITFLKNSGLHIICASEKASSSIYQSDYTVPFLLIMGNEEKGISNDILEMSDEIVKIPLIGNIKSLNVSVAASVIMYEAVRQRQY